MEYRLDQTEGGARVALNGRLTFAENAGFRAVVEGLEQVGGSEVVFDLGGMDYIDSAGLGMLLVAREAVERRGGRVRLRHGGGQVGRMLELARFGDFFALG